MVASTTAATTKAAITPIAPNRTRGNITTGATAPPKATITAIAALDAGATTTAPSANAPSRTGRANSRRAKAITTGAPLAAKETTTTAATTTGAAGCSLTTAAPEEWVTPRCASRIEVAAGAAITANTAPTATAGLFRQRAAAVATDRLIRRQGHVIQLEGGLTVDKDPAPQAGSTTTAIVATVAALRQPIRANQVGNGDRDRRSGATHHNQHAANMVGIKHGRLGDGIAGRPVIHAVAADEGKTFRKVERLGCPHAASDAATIARHAHSAASWGRIHSLLNRLRITAAKEGEPGIRGGITGDSARRRLLINCRWTEQPLRSRRRTLAEDSPHTKASRANDGQGKHDCCKRTLHKPDPTLALTSDKFAHRYNARHLCDHVSILSSV